MSAEGEPVSYRPNLLFDTNDPEFARGFEIGRMYGKLQAEPEVPMDFYLHETNIEMAMRAAEALKRETRCQDLNDDWLIILFGPTGKSLEEVDPSTIQHY